MKKSILLLVLFVFFASLIIISCGSQKKLTEGEDRKLSKGDKPDWVYNYKKKNTRDKRAVVGVSKNYAMESSARSDAILQAEKEAITLISSTIARRIKEALSSEGVDEEIVTEAAAKNDITELFSEGVFEGELEEFYIEKWEKMVAGTKKHYYKAYALLLFPKNLAEISAKKILARKTKKQMDEKRKRLLEQAQKSVENMNFDW